MSNLPPGVSQADLDRAIEESPEGFNCPNCGSTTGEPRLWDFGIDRETGYHDAGEGCSDCVREGR